jgi:hypothetical protein
MRQDFPIRYIEPVFHPPSEAQSLILPLTDGCSWNRCTFCEMYTAPQKRFHAREESEVLETINRSADEFAGGHLRPIADGLAQIPEPGQGGVVDDGFVEGHGFLPSMRLISRSKSEMYSASWR